MKTKRKRAGRKKRGMAKRIWLIVIFVLCISWVIVRQFPKSDTLKLSSENRQASISEEWNLIVVNRWNEIPKDYSVTLTELSNGQKVDSRIYPYLQEMFDDAREDGIYPMVREGYQTSEEQQEILDNKVQAYINEGYSKKKAEKAAREWVALPGTSEHQLGIAVDINADSSKSTNDEVYQWLSENAYLYGFILRYPQGKEDMTGTSYEPWHYRYVGEKAAKEIYEEGVCLEEYVKR